MKRVAEELDCEPKRVKRDDSLDKDPTQDETVDDLLNWTTSSDLEPRNISGIIVMKWPPIGAKYRIKLSLKPGAKQLESLKAVDKQLEVVFAGLCAERFRRTRLQFKVGQELHLSLRGAEIVKKALGASAQMNLPIVLKYAEGVTLKILPKGEEPGWTVDTWCKSPTMKMKSKQHTHVPLHTILPNPLNSIGNSLSSPATPRKSLMHAPSPFTTFSRPVSNIEVQASRSLAKANAQDKQDAPQKLPLASRSKSPTIANQQDASDSNILDAGHVEDVMATSSHAGAFENKTITTAQSGVPHPLDVPPLSESGLSKSRGRTRCEEETGCLKAGIPLAGSISTVSVSTTMPTTTPTMDFAKAHTGSPHAAPGRTPTDPTFSRSSTHIPDSRQPASPSSDSCTRATPAATQHRQIPPDYTPLSDLTAGKKMYSVIAVVTDIKTASRTKSKNWQCSLRIVDPSNCEESFPPAKEGLLINCFTKKHKQWLPTTAAAINKFKGHLVAVGYHDQLTWAVYDPSKGEIGHGDIGDAPRAERLDKGRGVEFTPFYEPTDEDSAYCLKLDDWWRKVQEMDQIGEGRPRRKHSLIRDVAMDEYFDCRVESRPRHESWCPPSLADRVFSIEMWDLAREEGPKMIPGAFYLLKNVRMMGRHGYAEGKLSEPKIWKLEPGDDDAFLKALLRRLIEVLVEELVEDQDSEAHSDEQKVVENAVGGLRLTVDKKTVATGLGLVREGEHLGPCGGYVDSEKEAHDSTVAAAGWAGWGVERGEERLDQ
ncbi:hypothetical protein GGX14DRAFT_602558 [Mycena pura]|uniref:Telomeric single stranded DNA binding POT1/Cdc13 domain-containing protein n=1 Tax=Mycena pura TaxID=153505 RepID=A0AAD6VM59_9AGAR|nr:hypothetical protein GGX14DRAFT_602558 [Mycena pura]